MMSLIKVTKLNLTFQSKKKKLILKNYSKCKKKLIFSRKRRMVIKNKELLRKKI
jgi:hypothetical protein